MPTTTDQEIKIDVVFLWVDGSDPLHQEKMKPFLPKTSLLGSKEFRTRYHQVDEIELAVRSIIKFASFVENIFIVTDNQIPTFILDYNKNKKTEWPDIEIVDHKVIFKGYDKYLPVFNSIPIETMVCYIPGLSEHFIYSNDDFFLIKECKPSDFFVKGKPIVRGKWTNFDENIWYKELYKRTFKFLTRKAKIKNKGYKIDQQNAARLLGFKKYFRMDHTPAPLRRSTLQNYYGEHPSFLDNALKPKFRSAGQCSVQSTANSIEINAKEALLLTDFQFGYFQSYKKPIVWYKLNMFLYKINPTKKFLTLQNLDLAPQKTLIYFLKWLEKLVDPSE